MKPETNRGGKDEQRDDAVVAGYSHTMPPEVAHLYKADDGWRLFVGAHSIDTLRKLRSAFADLADARVTELSLADLLDIPITGVARVELRLNDERSDFDKALHLQATDDGPDIVWTRGVSGWNYCAELIDALIQHDSPGHQYLSQAHADDLDVEVSYKEHTIGN